MRRRKRPEGTNPKHVVIQVKTQVARLNSIVGGNVEQSRDIVFLRPSLGNL